MAQNIVNEEILQSVCFQWHWNTYPDQRQMLFHTWQKSKNAAEGARAKAFGVVPGVSDLIYILQGKTVYIELKYCDGVQSIDQKAFEQKVKARGQEYYLVRTFDAFKDLIKTLNNGQ